MTAGDKPPRDRLVRLDGAALHVTELGPPDGTAAVLVHGFLTNALTWRHVAPKLAREHRVVLVDLPGCGRSPDPVRTRWTADAAADLLVALLDQLNLAAPVMAGSQMGGSLTAWVAARHPARLSGMVVMAAGALGEGSANLNLYRALAAPVVGTLVARSFGRDAFGRRWAAAHGPGFVPEKSAVDEYHRQLRRRGPAMARFGLGVRRSYGEDFDALAPPLEGCPVPTILVFGAEDRLVPPSTGRRFVDLLPDARLIEPAGCGDFPQEERPDEVTAALHAVFGRS